MHDSKLIQSIKVLTKEEVEGVKQLLNTDLLLKGSYKNEAIRLFDYILQFYPELVDPNLDRNITLKEIYKGEDSKINRLEKTMSSLLSVIDYYVIHFLSEQNFKLVRENMLLSKFYRKRGYSNRGKSLIKKNIEFLSETNEIIDGEYFNWIYLNNEENMVVNNSLGSTYTCNEYLELIDNMDEYALVRKLETFCRILYRYREFNFKANEILEKIENQINSNLKFKNNHLIQLFYNSLRMLQNDNNFEEYYSLFSRLFEANKNSLSGEIKSILAYFENICNILKYNKETNMKNLEMLHSTQKRHLKEGYLLIENKIITSTAISLVTNSVKLKDFKWLKSFLEEWKDYIGYPIEREDILKLCWALYYFALKDYEKAEDNIINKYDNIFYQLLARRLRIRIYYERKEDILLSYEVESHKVFVHRMYAKKVIDIYHYEANTNFCNRFKQIINLRHNPDEKTKERLLEKVKSQKCSDSEWLLEKIEEIKVPYSKS